MITIQYQNGYLILYSETPDENVELMKLFVNESRIIYDNGIWKVPDKLDMWLSHALIPMKHNLFVSESIRSWREAGSPKSAVIMCGVITSKVMKGSQDLPHKDMEEATRYFWKAAPNHPKYKSGAWDGYINLYKRWEHSFPTGLLYEIENVFIKKGIIYRIENTYNIDSERQYLWEICDNIVPDPDQIEAVRCAVEGRRGIVKAPTAFGKTAILAKRLLVAKGVPSLFVANKKTLLDDAASEFMSGIKGLTKCSCIKEGWFGDTKLPSTNIKPLDAQVICATIQSLHARLQDPVTAPYLLDWLHNKCKLVMADECQAVGTRTWDDVLNECYAPYRIFLSATPRRTDGATIKLMAGSGPILFTTTAEEQIKQGRLCELDITYQVYNQNIYNDYDADVNYNEMYKACITENSNRNREYIGKPAMEMVKEGRHVLVLIQFIDHGHILRDMFINEFELKPEDIRFIWGDTPDKVRKNAISEFRKGEFKIMIGSTIFDAGVNIPIISGVVLGGAGNSDITLIQRIGRGARTCDYGDVLGYLPEFMNKNHGKKITKVFDILDTNVKFFHKQGINRYYNARTEFGKTRVHVSGGDYAALKRTKNNQLRKDLDDMAAQLEMINEFSS